MLGAYTLSGCGPSDQEANLQGISHNGPLAVGAYVSIRPSDSCQGGGKLNFCSTERLIEVESLTPRDPRVAEIIPLTAMPAMFSNAPFYVHGLRAGKTTIDFRGRFDDGSVRTSSQEIEVRAIDRMQISSSCGNEGSLILTVPGKTVSVAVHLQGDGELLNGWLPDALLPLESLKEAPTENRTFYSWTAPSEPTSVTLLSSHVTGRVGTLRAFGRNEISKVVLSSRNPPPLSGSIGGKFALDAEFYVGENKSCETHALSIQSDTPSICSGPDGAPTWSVNDARLASVIMNAEGLCRVRASADGARFFDAVSIPIFATTTPEGTDLAGYGNPCSVEGSTTCAFSRTSAATCKGGRWQQAESCGSTRVCDFKDSAASGCIAGATCAACRSLR